jgi:HEAT repeat protein
VNRLGRVLKVRSGEGRTAVLGVGAIMSAAVGATFGQSGADALFFARSGVGRLPTMLLVSGGLMFAASFVLTALLGRVSPARMFVALPLVAAGVVLIERLFVAAHVGWIYPVLWLTVGVAQMVQGLFTWGTYGIVVDTRQAKRLFPLFGGGWILGWVIGGALTRPLAAVIGAENLLFVWAAGLVAAFVFGRAMLGDARRRPDAARRRSRRPTPGVLDEMQQGFRSVRASSVMRWMSLAAMLFSVLFFSLYLPFSRAATQRFPDADALAGFFGLFSAITAGAAFLWSLFFTSRLFARFGVTTMLLLFPVIYLLGFGVLAVHAVFATIVAFRFAQMLWLQAVANPAWEAVINVLPPTRRDQTRAFLNGAPAQTGTAIAGVIQLVGEHALSSRELSAIGVGTAALTTFACWRARRSYAAALLDALRAGRPQVFPTGPDEESVIGRGIDAAAVATVMAGVADSDVRVRRASVQILADVPGDEAAAALEAALRDDDATVRATALRSLAAAGRTEGLETALSASSDREPAVRAAAVRAVDGLVGDRPERIEAVRGLLADEDPAVRSAAASAFLKRSTDDQALAGVRALLAREDPADRLLAIEALDGSRLPAAFDLCAEGVVDPNPGVRAAAVRALGVADTGRAVPVLVGALGDRDPDVRAAAAEALGRVGPPAREPVLAALSDPVRAEGALQALWMLPADGTRDVLLAYAREETAHALADFAAARAIGTDGGDGATGLLREAMIDRARRRARNAMGSAALVGDRASSRFAIDNLSSRDPGQVANALEALDTLAGSVVRPLLQVWEHAAPLDAPREVWLPPLLRDPDPWIRSCAEFVSATTEGATMSDALTTLSEMQRVLFLRKVPLFAGLSPQELTRIASIAQERTYADGDTLAGEGETGDELFIVVDGEVRVLRAGSGPAGEAELARRSPGDVVGEMAIITQEPRMASLVASGDVRALRVGRREFEGILRERPDTAIAVIRLLSQRLAESADVRET